MSNQEGFSTVLLVLVLAVIIIIVAVLPGVISRRSQANDIRNQVQALNIAAPITTSSCNGGDGVDSGSQCYIAYRAPTTAIETALTNAGYTTAGAGLVQIFKGGNPTLKVVVTGSSSSASTSILATRYK